MDPKKEYDLGSVLWSIGRDTDTICFQKWSHVSFMSQLVIQCIRHKPFPQESLDNSFLKIKVGYILACSIVQLLNGNDVYMLSLVHVLMSNLKHRVQQTDYARLLLF